MIYLLDSKLSNDSHSANILEIIHDHTDEQVRLIELDENLMLVDLKKKIIDLLPLVLPKDIVLCPWAVEGDEFLDELFSDLADLCYVVASAGNFSRPIDDFTPARVENVLTVGALNKSGMIAALSNYSDSKDIIWLPGTNHKTSRTMMSGTSVSAALYACFLAEGIKCQDTDLVQQKIEELKEKVYREINPC